MDRIGRPRNIRAKIETGEEIVVKKAQNFFLKSLTKTQEYRARSTVIGIPARTELCTRRREEP
jgi:hypothetical protein